MHEFVRFAKSPFDMIAYDRRVRYEWPRSLRPPDNWDPEATQQQTTSPGRYTFPCRVPVTLFSGCNIVYEARPSFRLQKSERVREGSSLID